MARNKNLVPLEEAKKSEMDARFPLTLNLQGFLRGRNSSLKDMLMLWFITWFMLVAIYLQSVLYSDGSLIARYCPLFPSQDWILRSMCQQQENCSCLPLFQNLLPPPAWGQVQWNHGSAALSSFCGQLWPCHSDIFEVWQFLLVLIYVCF